MTNLSRNSSGKLVFVEALEEWFRFKNEYAQSGAIMRTDNKYTVSESARIGFENAEQEKRLDERIAVKSSNVPLNAQETEFRRREPETAWDSLSFKVGRAIAWLPRKILGRSNLK